MVNYGTDNKTKIKDLASQVREKIFDFQYPLSTKVDKSNFETMILNNFIDRRIGYETMTTFKIKLNVKLNEIMPVYNKMFDMIENWDIFNDGEEKTRIVTDNRNINNSNTQDIDGTITNTSQANTSTQTNSQTSVNDTKDIRKSDTPQNQLQDVRDGSYVTDYEYASDNKTGNDTSTNTGNSSSTGSNVEDRTITNSGTITNQGNLQETISKSPAEKMKLYTEFIEKRNHIYTMIFKELDCLFYQLV